MSKKLLVVQFRTDASKPHEQKCFVEDLPHHKHRLEFVSAIDNNFPKDLSPYAGVIFGGSGEFMLGDGAGVGSWRENTFRFIDKVIDTDTFSLGICFGYQMLALHQGAGITNNIDMRETGTFKMKVSHAGKNDQIFRNLPQTFDAQFGHKETIVDVPLHLVTTASTDRVECSSFRFKGKNIWGTLSHPELNPDRMRDRVKLFPAYTNGKSLDEVLQGFYDAPHSSKLLHNFVDMLNWELCTNCEETVATKQPPVIERCKCFV